MLKQEVLHLHRYAADITTDITTLRKQVTDFPDRSVSGLIELLRHVGLHLD